jgi:hypothetical protein
MPNANRGTSLFLGTAGGPDNVNVSLSSPPVAGSFTPYAPGDLGVTFEYQDKAYTVVVLDSGATSANPVGAPAKNNVLFWKDKANRIVTNDFRQCITPTVPGASQAGVLRITPGTLGTGGNMICMLIRGYAIPVTSGTSAIGPVMVDTTASTARVVTAVGTAVQFGSAIAANAGGNVTMNVDVPQLP